MQGPHPTAEAVGQPSTYTGLEVYEYRASALRPSDA